MTIKELCDNQECCKTCPFVDACGWLNCNAPFAHEDDVDKAITKAIIDTAKILESEDKNND